MKESQNHCSSQSPPGCQTVHPLVIRQDRIQISLNKEPCFLNLKIPEDRMSLIKYFLIITYFSQNHCPLLYLVRFLENVIFKEKIQSK